MLWLAPTEILVMSKPGLPFPLRAHMKSEIRWVAPTYTAIHHVLTNRKYAVACTYGNSRHVQTGPSLPTASPHEKRDSLGRPDLHCHPSRAHQSEVCCGLHLRKFSSCPNRAFPSHCEPT